MAILPEGTTIFKVKQRSGSGNWSVASQFTINVDITPPVIGTIAITNLDGGTRVNGHQNGLIVDVSSITDALSGVDKTLFSTSSDGVVYENEITYSGAQLSHTFNNINLHSPIVYVKVGAYDVAGNYSGLIASIPVEYIGIFDFSQNVNEYVNIPGNTRV